MKYTKILEEYSFEAYIGIWHLSSAKQECQPFDSVKSQWNVQ